MGVFLRPEIVEANPHDGDYLLVYLRRKMAGNVLEALRQLKLPARVYGLGRQESSDGLEFRAIDELQFVEDLAGCRAVVCSAGNQLVGEAQYLGKPVLALPETNNFEQAINAHFLRAGGGGDWVAPARLSVSFLKAFLSQSASFQEQMPPQRNGLSAAVAIVQRHLVGGRRTVPMMSVH